MSLRSVAVDSFIITTTDPVEKRCHVIWTTGTDVYFRDWVNDLQGKWDSNEFDNQQDGATTQWEEYFVDASTSTYPSSNIITAYAVWGVEGTAVFFGTDP
jgi:hypothetical protein